MPTYRIECASSSRAGCKNKECQDRKDKIPKGELRLGSWIEAGTFQSWAWKHWGCVTPRQIVGVKEAIGDDMDFDMLDGYDELSSEQQQKVREAVEQGHVADEDWKGDIELNRPGQNGFRVKASKKAQKDADESQKDDDDDKSEASAKAPKGKKRKQESASATDGKNSDKPAKRPTKRSKAQKKVESDDDKGDEEPQKEENEENDASSSHGEEEKAAEKPVKKTAKKTKAKAAEPAPAASTTTGMRRSSRRQPTK